MEHINLKVSLIQMNVVADDFEANLSRAKAMLNVALKQRKKPNVIVLPEMWTSNLYKKINQKYNSLYVLDELKEIASRNSVNIVAG